MGVFLIFVVGGAFGLIFFIYIQMETKYEKVNNQLKKEQYRCRELRGRLEEMHENYEHLVSEDEKMETFNYDNR